MMRRSAFGRLASPGGPRSRADVPTRQFPLFKLVRVLGLRARRRSVDLGQGVSASSESLDDEMLASPVSSTQAPLARRIGNTLFGLRDADSASTTSGSGDRQIVHWAVGGCVGHAFMAFVLSDDRLLIRYAGDSGFPFVRQVQWFRDPQKRIVALDFNNTAEWLAVVCADQAVMLLPVYALMHNSDGQPVIYLPKIAGPAPRGAMSTAAAPPPEEDGSWFSIPSIVTYAAEATGLVALPATSAFAVAPPLRTLGGEADLEADLGPNDDATLVIAPARGVRALPTCCRWWNTWQKQDILIIGYQQGALAFVDLRLRRQELVNIRVKATVTGMEIIEDTATPFRCLLIHDASGTTWRLVLEQENDEHVIETLLTCSGRAPFVPVPLQRFAPGLHLSVQRYKRAPMVGVHNYDNQKLEIYDIDLDKYPLYVYQLFPDVTSAILTDKVIFAASTRTVGPARISVVSNIIAGTSGNPVYALDRKIKESIMQMFTLAPNETLLAIVPAFPISRMMANKFRQEEADATPEGCIVITSCGVYELRAHIPAEQIFTALLSQDRAAADALGKTMQLDIFRLYESAADQQFFDGNYDAALELYVMSNVNTSKLIDLYLHVDRVDVVLPYLSAILHDPAAIPVSDRRKYADTVFKIHAHKLLVQSTVGPGGEEPPAALALAGDAAISKAMVAATQAAGNVAAVRGSSYGEFKRFLLQNTDYDAGIALMELIKHGWSELFFEVAHARRIMPVALNILVNRGALHISRPHIRFLLQHEYTETLMSCSGGVLLRCMQPSDQLDIILSLKENAAAHVYDILLILPYLDEQRLKQTIRHFDPRNAAARAAAPNAAATPADVREKRDEECTELFLTALVVLLARMRDAAGVEIGSPTVARKIAPMPAANLSPLVVPPRSPPKVPGGRARRNYTFGTSPKRPHFVDKRLLVETFKSQRGRSVGASDAPSAPKIVNDELADMESAEQFFFAQLRSLMGKYSSTAMIERCLLWHDWNTAAEIYEIMHEWPSAMEYRLRAIAATYGVVDDGEQSDNDDDDDAGQPRRQPGDATREASEAHETVNDALAEIGKMATPCIARSVFVLFDYWHARQLPASQLEALLSKHMASVAGTVGAIMARDPSSEEAEVPETTALFLRKARQLLSEFSTEFCLRVTKTRLDAMEAKNAKVQSTRVPSSRLWSEIKVNLDKEADRRTSVVVPTTVFPLIRSENSTIGMDTDVVAFTCSHYFNRREFMDVTLPELRRRLEQLPSGLPLTTKLISMDYQQTHINSACPHCLFNFVRAESIKTMPEVERQTRAWMA